MNEYQYSPFIKYLVTTYKGSTDTPSEVINREVDEVYRKAAAADKMDEYLLEKYNEYMNKAFKDDDRSLEFAKVLEESRRVGLEIILEMEDEE